MVLPKCNEVPTRPNTGTVTETAKSNGMSSKKKRKNVKMETGKYLCSTVEPCYSDTSMIKTYLLKNNFDLGKI